MTTILSYYEFLEKEGIERSSQSKKLYRRYYQRLYQRQRRKDRKEVTLHLSHDEYLQIKAAAIKHGHTAPAFLIHIAQSYLSKKYIVPNEQTISRLEQILSLTYSEVQYLSDQSSGDNIEALTRHALNTVSRLESQVEAVFRNPLSLEETITQTLKNHPHYYQTITNLIKAYDNQSQST